MESKFSILVYCFEPCATKKERQYDVDRHRQPQQAADRLATDTLIAAITCGEQVVS
ncbi:MAG: hypothetical protein ABSH41_19695 [Syntrophobacteraceae bacterium]|jgi:hypothetical protein